MRARRFLVVALLASALRPAVAAAFDGQRQGLVIGGGLGVSPASRWSAGDDGERFCGAGAQFVVGWAWSGRDLVAYEENITLFASDRYNSDSLLGPGDLLTAQGFRGVSWYHYPGPAGRTLFTAIGLGVCEFARGEGYHSDPGGAFLLGAGCEFSRHLQVGLYYSAGRTFDAGHAFSHRHLSLLLSGFAF